MIFIKYLTIIIFSAILKFCTKNVDIESYDALSNIYISACKNLRKKKYNNAIKELLFLNNYYPLSFYNKQIQIDLIYAYYKSYNLLSSKIFIDRFIKLNPTYKDIDYVFYIKGLINMKLDNDNLLKKFLNMNIFDRNQEYIRAAFLDFIHIIYSYPDSDFYMDTIKHLVYIKDRLIKHELFIIKYYDKIGAYIAVIKHIEEMLINFQDSKEILQILPYMEKSYKKLQLNDQASKVRKIILFNLN